MVRYKWSSVNGVDRYLYLLHAIRIDVCTNKVISQHCCVDYVNLMTLIICIVLTSTFKTDGTKIDGSSLPTQSTPHRGIVSTYSPVLLWVMGIVIGHGLLLKSSTY